MFTFHVHYEHTSASGGVTTGFNSISANNEAEACEKFYSMHDGSYRITRVERV